MDHQLRKIAVKFDWQSAIALFVPGELRGAKLPQGN
jgi:hypothetical protein